MIQETLVWKGPYKFIDKNTGAYILDEEVVKTEGGLYLWTIKHDNDGHYYPIYVGKANHFYDRFVEHIRYMFSGNYWLYDFNKIRFDLTSKNDGPLYKADESSFNKGYFDNFEIYSKLAFHNMNAYDYFFAKVPFTMKSKLSIFESKIISDLRNGAYAFLLDNQRLSVRIAEDEISLEHEFESVTVVGMNQL